MTATVVTADCVLLVNPTSGKGRGLAYGRRAEAVLTAGGRTVETVVGRSAAEAVDLAARAIGRGAGMLVVVGGDGMVNAALPLVAGTGTALGLIPAGTGNDTARFLGLPLQDPEAAARAVLSGRTRAFDLGQVQATAAADAGSAIAPPAGPRWFATVLACGLDSKVNERANRMRRPRGSSRYTLALLAELLPFRAPWFRIRLDEAEPIDRRCMLIAVGNGPSYGGGMRICAEADPHDGRFQVTAVSRVGKLTLLRIFPRVFAGTHLKHPKVDAYQAAQVVLSGPDAAADGSGPGAAPVSVWADGEYIGLLPATVTAVPGALTAFVPEPVTS
ncbi:MAG TPA: diacylglycerol kinase family protein [Actinocrinis sp.]|nr:diacylglycerol kinase family protein [Actinocrinis sp.]